MIHELKIYALTDNLNNEDCLQQYIVLPYTDL